MKKKVLVVGLGQIGMGYDLYLQDTDHLLTHVKSIFRHDFFELCCGVDEDSALRKVFEKEYNCPSSEKLEESLTEFKPSLIVIATPSNTHYKILNRILDSHIPEAILCEKPLAYDFAEANEMVRKCEKKGVALFVNYIRRSDPAAIEIKRMIEDGTLQKPMKASVWYSKGMFNNASHLSNILEFWFGECIESKLISEGRKLGKYDYEPDFYMQFDGGSATFQSVWEENYSHYSIQILCTSGMLNYQYAGEEVTWHPIKLDEDFSGYTI